MTESKEVVEYEEPQNDGGSMNLFRTNNPAEVIERATAVADELKKVLEKQGLISTISGRRFVRAEGWTTLGAMVSVFPRIEWTRPLIGRDGDVIGWEAACEVVNGSGIVIGRAEAECLRTEQNWRSRDDYALRSMAQTRALSKAMRMPLGFIAVLAGYEATPADEMEGTEPAPKHTGSQSPPRETKAVKLERVRAEQKRLIEAGHENWSDEKLCAAAKQHWGREYTKLDDFTKEELDAVLQAAADTV